VLASGGLLCREASRVRVSQFCLKTGGDGGWCMWHHRGGHVEVKQKMVGSLASGAAQ
jgi:hypothetical protein